MADDPDTLIDLVRTSNELQAISLIAELEAHGIPARAFNVGIMQYQMPMLQPQRIMVRRSDLARAREVLRELEPPDGGEVDWASVDTGDDAPLTAAEEAGPLYVCGRCGHSRQGLPADWRCPDCGALPAQQHELTPDGDAGGFVKHLIWVIAAALALLVLLGMVLSVGGTRHGVPTYAARLSRFRRGPAG